MSTDTELLDWLEAHYSKVREVIYVWRHGLHGQRSLREAIGHAMHEQHQEAKL